MIVGVEDAPWIRARADGFAGVWHMPAGETRVGALAACDRPFPDRSGLEEKPVRTIPLGERCQSCQEVHAARERAESA